ncbi:MAG TPA: D-ribose ABC transporter substrate-binding protein, partial [Candidatus Acetothermia bacterium]|nr:D-ribose ABC transporter substrate-binding protein [Candidatus Acetothermia bacterium]
MRRLLLGLLVIGILGLGALAAGKYTIAVFISTLKNPYFVTLADGAKAAGEKFGVDVVIYDAQDDAAKQMSQIEDALAAGVDAICINPVNAEALIPAVEEANKAGI